MKLTVGDGAHERGFALPTILLVSTVMLTILVASIAATAASRVSLDSQYYNQLAKQAAQSGVARAMECLQGSGYTPQWSTAASSRDLRPNSDCTGATRGGASLYVVGDGTGPTSNVRTTYTIDAPTNTTIGATLRVIGKTELVRGTSPYTVWRTYEQSLYYTIEAPEEVACPAGFISVPGDSRFGTTNFCVGKYETKNVGGKAVSQAAGAPYNMVSQTRAATIAANACNGCQLITEAQWLTIAHNITNVNSNWTGGSVGSGTLYRGHSDSSPGNPVEASSDDTNGYFNTGNSSGEQRRTLRLSNGEVIWDFSGNSSEWTAGTVSGAGNQPGPSGPAMRDWSTVTGTGTLIPNPFPAFATPAASAWTGTQGIGRILSDGGQASLRGFIRGGNYNDNTNAGVFAMGLDNDPGWERAYISFRMAFQPLSEITCSSGFVPVPGNSMFNTKDFCVSKYEAKNVSGTARSVPGGMPWTSINQASAVTAASASCPTCRLIGEAEWLTIAHNAASVGSNWTGGTVGSGSMYTGHSDNSPSTSLIASSNDADGYYQTGNSSGTQRRTLTLSNGEVIWDFSGNVYEWTSAQMTGGQPGSSGWSAREWNSVTNTSALVPNPFPTFATPAASSWTSSNGIGRILSNSSDTSLRGFRRGGYWYNDGTSGNAGVFQLAINLTPSDTSSALGFRIVEIK